MIWIDIGLMHDGGQTGGTVVVALPIVSSYLPSQMSSQPSSASAVASLPLARWAWQAKTHFTYLPAAFPTLASHFWVTVSGGMKPLSSPPKGSPGAAQATPTAIMIASRATNTNLLAMSPPSLARDHFSAG